MQFLHWLLPRWKSEATQHLQAAREQGQHASETDADTSAKGTTKPAPGAAEASRPLLPYDENDVMFQGKH